jgi:hypothetical protein
VVRNFRELAPTFADERDELERRWVDDSEIDPETALSIADRALESWTEGVARRDVPDVRPLWARKYWEKRNRRSGLNFFS